MIETSVLQSGELLNYPKTTELLRQSSNRKRKKEVGCQLQVCSETDFDGTIEKDLIDLGYGREDLAEQSS